MRAIYAETSAVLAWLLGEGSGPEIAAVIDSAETVLTSELTGVEVRRALVRAELVGLVPAAAAGRLLGVFEGTLRSWIVATMTPEILTQAGSRFPAEPIRSRDAIHLATVLDLLRAVPRLEVLSLDRRISDNLVPLGLTPALAV